MKKINLDAVFNETVQSVEESNKRKEEEDRLRRSRMEADLWEESKKREKEYKIKMDIASSNILSLLNQSSCFAAYVRGLVVKRRRVEDRMGLFEPLPPLIEKKDLKKTRKMRSHFSHVKGIKDFSVYSSNILDRLVPVLVLHLWDLPLEEGEESSIALVLSARERPKNGEPDLTKIRVSLVEFKYSPSSLDVKYSSMTNYVFLGTEKVHEILDVLGQGQPTDVIKFFIEKFSNNR